MTKPSQTLIVWTRLAKVELAGLLRRARRFSTLRMKGPTTSRWQVEVRVVGAQAMKLLNTRYRQKKSVTDVLSFPFPRVFFDQGFLGELVICLPVLKKQAKEQQHSMQEELRVLLAHGLLHLLGFDHEKSTREARQMRKWEGKLLGRSPGLIRRSLLGSA